MVDKYGRDVNLVSGAEDVYTISEASITKFIVSFPLGTSLAVAMAAIEANAPGGYIEPVPMSIDTKGYVGVLIVSIDSTGPTTITLPVDITTGIQAYYTVGKNVLDIYLNGQSLAQNTDFVEVGPVEVASDQVTMLNNLTVGDSLLFKIK